MKSAAPALMSATAVSGSLWPVSITTGTSAPGPSAARRARSTSSPVVPGSW
jgi:hypothetical protein